MTSPASTLVIVARAPELGRVKTRLAAALGAERALAIYRELGVIVARAVTGAAATTIVAYTPAESGPLMREWLGDGLAYEAQCDGDLGARMAATIAARLAEGAERVVVIGADCPTVDADLVRAAFDALDRSDVVLGPAHDGGYYLIGMTRLHDSLFADMPWSGPVTCATTLERARLAGLAVHLLPAMRDIDTADDWDAYARDDAEPQRAHGRLALGGSERRPRPPHRP